MSDLTPFITFLVVACLTFAMGVWLLVKAKMKIDRARSGASGGEGGSMDERRKMQVGDWFNAAINLIIGLLLGSVVDRLVQLVTSGLWLSAVVITLLGAGFFVFMLVFDKVTDPLFSIGIRPAPKPQVKGRTPLLRLMSFPVGVLLGVLLARLGLDDKILGLIP